MISVFKMKDLHKMINKVSTFSRYYSSDMFGQGAMHIDRLYHYGYISSRLSIYKAIPFSDHLAQVVTYTIPAAKNVNPNPRV